MVASISKVMTAFSAAALLGGVLTACSDDSLTRGDHATVVGGFVSGPWGPWYASSDRDTLQNFDGVAFPPVSVHVRRAYAEDERGVTSPDDASAYVESILRTSLGKLVTSYVIEDERTSVDFETRDLASFGSVFGETTHDNHVYGVQLYTDLGTDDRPAPRDYVSTARWYTFERRPGVSPYDGSVYEFFGTYGVRTWPPNLRALGSASYEGNILGNIWDTGDPNRRTGSDLIRGTLALHADLEDGDIGGRIFDFRRFDRGADDPAWQALADTNAIDIAGNIEEGRFTADWTGGDSGDAPAVESIRGFSGTMLGEFYGPAGEEVGGVLRGHRAATVTTPEQIFNGFFSAGMEPEAAQ